MEEVATRVRQHTLIANGDDQEGGDGDDDDDNDDGDDDDDELGQDLLSPSVTILPYLQQSPQMTVTVRNLLDPKSQGHSLKARILFASIVWASGRVAKC